jgi:hypothetical protein
METERETEEIEKLSPKRNTDKGNEGKERCYIRNVGAPVEGVSDLLHPFPCLLIQWRHQAISGGHAGPSLSLSLHFFSYALFTPVFHVLKQRK